MSDQLDLFAPREEKAPLEWEASLLDLASRVPGHVRLGTSSWTFPGWAGLVYRRRYPNQATFVRESLKEYAEHPLFRTVGIDRSFYAPLRADELRAYAKLLPDGFPCVMKVYNELTTRVFPKAAGARAGKINRAFLDPDRFRRDVCDPVVEAFADHLGAFLLEVPPAGGPVNPIGFADKLDQFLAAAPSMRFCVELRDKRLLTPAYVEVLRRRGAAHVFNYWTWMPTLREQLARVGEPTADFVVIRLMVPPGKRYADLKAAFEPFDRLVAPQDDMRQDVLRLIESAAGRETFVLVNNKVEGSSPRTARALARLVVERFGKASFPAMKATNITWHRGEISREDRAKRHGHRGATLWFTGLSGSGKSTLSFRVERLLLERGCFVYVLDGDNVRHGLNGDLGFGPEDRKENVRRVGELARLFTDAGAIVLTAFISPYREDRDRVRHLMDEGDFIEVHVAADLATCESRDPKGLYKKARSGEIADFTGISAPYEEPLTPEIRVDTGTTDVDTCAATILAFLQQEKIIPPT